MIRKYDFRKTAEFHDINLAIAFICGIKSFGFLQEMYNKVKIDRVIEAYETFLPPSLRAIPKNFLIYHI